MDTFLQPVLQSSLVDRVLRYNFGLEHPNRKRSQILKNLKINLGIKIPQGSGTNSIIVSVALPIIIAEADRQGSLAIKIKKAIDSLKVSSFLNLLIKSINPVMTSSMYIITKEVHSKTSELIEEASKKFTNAMENLSRTESTFTMDKGRIVRVDGPWTLISIGDPREDSYRLERVPTDGLAVSGLESNGDPFIRIVMHESERAPRKIYMPAWEPDKEPSDAMYEVLLRATPAKAVSDSEEDQRFTPKPRKH